MKKKGGGDGCVGTEKIERVLKGGEKKRKKKAAGLRRRADKKERVNHPCRNIKVRLD